MASHNLADYDGFRPSEAVEQAYEIIWSCARRVFNFFTVEAVCRQGEQNNIVECDKYVSWNLADIPYISQEHQVVQSLKSCRIGYRLMLC